MDTSPDFVIINRHCSGDRFFIAGMNEGAPGEAKIGLYAQTNRAALQTAIEYMHPSKANRRLIWIRQANARNYIQRELELPAVQESEQELIKAAG